MRIEKENQAFATRLFFQKSEFNKSDLEADFKSKHKTYKKLIQRVEPVKSKPKTPKSVFEKFATLQSRIAAH